MKELCRNKKNIILVILFAGYLIFNGIMLAGHELWRDEANVWLFARDASPVQLLREIKYQGHPCLWYFMVMPFAKLGLPFEMMSVLSFLIMAAGALVFVWNAPFHPATKAVCLFSPIFSYYYSVVARNYCLIALLLILLACFYEKRNEKPMLYGLMLGLLVQADTIALATAGLISCMWLWECAAKSIREKKWLPLLQAAKGLWIPLFSLFFWILQFYQVSDSPEYNMRVLSFGEMLTEVKYFTYHILTRMTGQEKEFDLLLIVIFVIAGVLLSVKKKNFWPMIVMAGAFLFEVVFSIMVYQLHIWHYITICFTLIWFLWLMCRQDKMVGKAEAQKEQEQSRQDEKNCNKGDKIQFVGRILAEGLLILFGITMFIRWNAPEENSSMVNAFTGLYSDGVHAADYIAENITPESLILSTDVSEASTVQAYLGEEYGFYYAGSLEKATYAKYNEEQSQAVTYEELLAGIREAFPKQEYVYLLKSPANCIQDVPEDAEESWEICYQTKEKTARGEEYTLYRIVLP